MAGCWKEPTTKDVYRLSVASLLITGFFSWFGIAVYAETGSCLCFVFGIENVVDFISSIIVLWRFFVPWNLDESIEIALGQREQRASLAISFIMVLLGITITSAAIADFADGPEDMMEQAGVILISPFAFVAFGVLSRIKFRFGRLLDSESLRKDGMCSWLGTILAAVLFVSTTVVIRIPFLWWTDPSSATIVGVYAIRLGVKDLMTAHRSNIPLFSMIWWGCKGAPMDMNSERPSTMPDSQMLHGLVA